MAWRKRAAAVPITVAATVLLHLPAGFAWAAEEKPRAPDTVDLTTKDGLRMKATYYGQPVESKQKVVPIVLLHDFKGNRNTLGGLALSLQQEGHAVIVPDLRGHGDSTKLQVRGQHRNWELEATSMRRNDFAGMGLDMEAVRKFLVDKNDAEEVNLNELCVVGAGMGATVALNWTAHDWSAPPLAMGKQGQDVKVLVLISPEWSFKGITIQDALRVLADRRVGDKISVLILVGRNNARALRDARRIYKTLERWHSEPGPGEGAGEKTLRFFPIDNTSLQGVKLLGAGGEKLQQGIAKFVWWRAAQQDYPWRARRATSN